MVYSSIWNRLRQLFRKQEVTDHFDLDEEEGCTFQDYGSRKWWVTMKYLIFIMSSLVSWWMFFFWISSNIHFEDSMEYGAFLYTSVFAFSPFLSALVTYFTYKFCVKSKSTFQFLTMIYILTSIYGFDSILKI